MTRLLAAQRAPVFAALLGIVLTLPALGVGIFGDDYMHRSILLGVGDVGHGARPVFDLFSFVPQDGRREATFSSGTVTWWAHPEISIALFRPLSVATHVIDYRLWPNSFLLQHLHSLLWYGLGVLLVAAVYQRVHGAGMIAGVAALLFAVDDAHAMCVGWLANRHALVSLAMGVFALHAHIQWRQSGDRKHALLAVAVLILALFCGEAALGAAAYIVAWHLTMEQGPLRERVAVMVPYGVVIVLWRLLYNALGYGTHGTALYIDPGDDPVDLVLLLSRPVQLVLAASAALVCVLLIALFAPLLERKEARFWALGMSLALIPLCAAFPMDRLLLFSGVGAFALLAMLAERHGLIGAASATASVPAAAPPRHIRGRACAVALLLLHGPLAAALLAVRVAILPWFGTMFVAGLATLPLEEKAPQQTYVFVNGHEFPVVYLMIIGQLERPERTPRRVALLGSLLNDNIVEREDSDTLVITAAGGFLRASSDQLLRRVDVPFRIGERIDRRDFSAEIRAITADGRPQQVAFHFHGGLDSPELRWLTWTEHGVIDFSLPEIGMKLDLPSVSLNGLLGFNANDDVR